MKRFLIGFGILVFAVAGLAAYTSMQYWGYLFLPPPVENVLSLINNIENYSYMTVRRDLNGEMIVAASTLDTFRQEPLLRVIKYIDTVNTLVSYDRDLYRQITPLLIAADWQLFPIDSETDTCGQYCAPSGFIIRGTADDGTALIFINVTSENAVYGDDDHYHYYEGLFALQSDGSYQLIKEQRYQYDVAGIEGFTFIPIFIIYLLLASTAIAIISLPISVMYMIRQRYFMGKRKRKSHLLQ